MNDKKPWVVLPSVWKSESSFWVWVRGILRKGWSRHPVKIAYIHKHRKRIKNPNVKSAKKFPEVWGMTCEQCGVEHVQGNIEIDHKGDNATFTGLKDCGSYVSHLYLVDFESLQAVCKPCHKAISHSQNLGVSFEEAVMLKEVIRIVKEERVEDIVAFCEDYEYSDNSSAAKRKKNVEAILRSIN